MASIRFTAKQRAILEVLATGNVDGTPIDLDQILERLEYETSKESLQFSLRSLVKHKIIEKVGREKRRNRQRVLYELTKQGRFITGVKEFSDELREPPKFIQTDDDEVILEDF